MANTPQENEALKAVEPMAAPAAAEAEILGVNEDREKALKEGEKDSAQEQDEGLEKLPPLSAADFKIYNSMADHMEYFVRGP